MFLELPGAGGVHLLDMRAHQGCGIYPFADGKWWDVTEEFDGALYAHYGNGPAYGDLTIPGPLGWAFEGKVLPAGDFLLDINICSRSCSSRNTIHVPACKDACSVFLKVSRRDALARACTTTCMTPSMVYTSAGTLCWKKLFLVPCKHLYIFNPCHKAV